MTQIKGASAKVDLTVTTGDLKLALEQFQSVVNTIKTIPKATGDGSAAVNRLASALKQLAKDSDTGDVANALKLVSKELKTVNALAKGTEIFTKDQANLARVMADRVKLYSDQALLQNKMLGKGVSERAKLEMDEALRVNRELGKILKDRQKLYEDQALLENRMLGKGVSEKRKMQLDEELRQNKALGKILDDRAKLYEQEALRQNKLAGRRLSEKSRLEEEEELRKNRELGKILDDRIKLYEQEALRQNKLKGKQLSAKQRLEEEEELRKNRELGKILDERAKLYQDEALRQNRLKGKQLSETQRLQEEEELRKNRELGKILDDRVKLYQDEALRQNRLAGKQLTEKQRLEEEEELRKNRTLGKILDDRRKLYAEEELRQNKLKGKQLTDKQRLEEEEELRKNRELGKILDERIKLYADEELRQNKLKGKQLTEKQRLQEEEELRKNRSLGAILDERIKLYEAEALRQNKIQGQIMQWRRKVNDDEDLEQNRRLGQMQKRQKEIAESRQAQGYLNPTKTLAEFAGETNLGKAGKLQTITADGHGTAQVIAAQREVRKIQQDILDIMARGNVTDKERADLIQKLLAAKREELALNVNLNKEQREAEAAQRALARIGGQGGAGLMAIQASLMANYSILNLFTGSIQRAISSSIELEAAFRNVQAVTGTTRTEMHELEKTIEQTAAGTKFSSVEVAEAALILGQAGLSAKQVGEAIPAVTMLAAAAGSNLAQAVDLVTSVIGVFAKNAGDTADIANKITQAANSSKVSIEKLALGFQYAGNIAAQSGISFEETTAAMAAMSNAGIKSGSTMGTGLRQFLTETEKPSQAFLDIMTRLGLTMSDLDFKSNGLIGVANKLREAGFVASDAIQSFDVRGAAAFNALIANPEDMERQYKLLLNTKAGVEANEIQMDSFKSQATRLTTSLENLASTGLGPTIKALTVITGAVASVVQGMSEMNVAIPILGTGLAALALTATGTYMANLGIEVWKIVKALPIFQTGLAAITSALGMQTAAAQAAAVATTGATAAMSTLSLASGIGIGITVLVGAVTAWNYVMGENKRHLDELRAASNETKEAFDSKTQSVKELDAKLQNLSAKEILLRNDSEAVKRETQAVTSQFGSLGGVLDSNNTSFDALIQKLQGVRSEMIKLRNVNLGVALQAGEEEVKALGEQAKDSLTKAQAKGTLRSADSVEKFLSKNEGLIDQKLGKDQRISIMNGLAQLKAGDLSNTTDLAYLPDGLRKLMEDKTGIGMDDNSKKTVSYLMNNVQAFNTDNAKLMGKRTEVEGLRGQQARFSGRDKFEKQNPNFVSMFSNIPNLEEMAKSGVSAEMAKRLGIAERAPMDPALAKKPDELATITKAIGTEVLRARKAAADKLDYTGVPDDAKGEIKSLIATQESEVTGKIKGVQNYAKDTVNFYQGNRMDEITAQMKTISQRKNRSIKDNDDMGKLINEKWDIKDKQDTFDLIPSTDPENAPGKYERAVSANRRQREEELTQYGQKANGTTSYDEKETNAKLKTLKLKKGRTDEETKEAEDLIRQKWSVKTQNATFGKREGTDEINEIYRSYNVQMEEELKQFRNKNAAAGGRDRTPGNRDRNIMEMYEMEAKAEKRAAEIDRSLAGMMENYDDVTNLMDKGTKHLENAGEATKKKLLQEQAMKRRDQGLNSPQDDAVFKKQMEALEEQLLSEMEQYKNGFKGFASIGFKKISEMTKALKKGEQDFANSKLESEDRVYERGALLRELQLEQELGKKIKPTIRSTATYKNSSMDGTSYSEKGDSASSRRTDTSIMRFGPNGVSSTMSTLQSDRSNIGGILGGLDAGVSTRSRANLGAGAMGNINATPLGGTLKQRIARETIAVAEFEKAENEKLLAELGDDKTGLIGGYTELIGTTTDSIKALQPELDRLRKLMNNEAKPRDEDIMAFNKADAQMKELKATAASATTNRIQAKGQVKGVRTNLYKNEKDIAQNTESLPQEVTLDSLEAKVKSVWQTWSDAQKDMDPMKTFGDGFGSMLGNVTGQFGNMFSEIASGTNSVSGAFKSMAGNVIRSIMSVIAQMLAMKAVQMLIGMFSPGVSGSAATAASVSPGPAAFGTIPGSTFGAVGSGFSTIGIPAGVATGGLILSSGQVERIRHMADGGTVNGGVAGKDSVPTMLMPGEFVVKKSAVDAVGTDYLHSLNQSANSVVSSSSPSSPGQESGGGGVVNVWVVSPDQQPSGLGPRDVVVTVTDDISRGGSIKKMIKQVMMGTV